MSGPAAKSGAPSTSCVCCTHLDNVGAGNDSSIIDEETCARTGFLFVRVPGLLPHPFDISQVDKTDSFFSTKSRFGSIIRLRTAGRMSIRISIGRSHGACLTGAFWDSWKERGPAPCAITCRVGMIHKAREARFRTSTRLYIEYHNSS